MVRARKLIRPLVWGNVLWLVGVSGGPVLGQQAGPDVPTTGPVAEEVSEALDDLDEAGVPPSAEETATFVRELAEHSRPRFGALGMRMGYRPESGRTGSVGLTLGPGSWHVRARGRFDASGIVGRAAVAGWDHPVVTLRVGFLGFRHGFGLLMAPPGRSASLGADQSLGQRAARFTGWTGTVDHRTWVGLGVGLVRGRWRIHGLVGQDPDEVEPEGTRLKFMRVAMAGSQGHVAVAALATGLSRAVSLSGVHSGDTHEGAMEGVVWLNPAGEQEGWAGVAHGAWRPNRRHGVEASWAVADRSGNWDLGSRPSVLPAWSGHGYALRFRSTPGPGMSVRGLWHQGWALPGAGPDDRSQRRLTELQWHQGLAPGWDLALRYRRSSTSRWEWSHRHPWLPAVPTPSDLKTVITGNLTYDRKTWRVGMMARTLDREAAGGSGRRSMLAFQYRTRPHPEWILRFFAATAWGQDVDLVSAIVPFAGLVLPRHWGKWRSETGLGVSRDGPRWAVRLAGGVRRPEPGREKKLDPWMRAAWDWRW
jgi:hypothetical protein